MYLVFSQPPCNCASTSFHSFATANQNGSGFVDAPQTTIDGAMALLTRRSDLKGGSLVWNLDTGNASLCRCTGLMRRPRFYPGKDVQRPRKSREPTMGLVAIRAMPEDDRTSSPATSSGGSGRGGDDLDVLETIQSLGALGERLVTLPRTTMGNLSDRVESLKTWQAELSKGILPRVVSDDDGEGGEENALVWPEEPFQSQFLNTLAELEMASLTRRYPKLANTLLKNMMDLVEAFEANFTENVEEEDVSEDETPQQSSNMRAALQDDGSEESSEEKPLPDPNQDLVNDLIEDFKKEWEPIAEALDASEQFFEDMTDMVDMKDNMDHNIDTLSTSQSLWKHSGWKEIKDLSRKLEKLPQLRTLVRDLGRGSRGRGPKRLANAEEYKSGNPEGLISSNLVIEETAGVFRSGEIMNMLPSEASLLAAGKRKPILKQLWHSKRIERSLLSYERVGWMEDEPSNVLEVLEIRPSGVQGPIILCLDTSASMAGQREKVAKALVLECIRGAKLQHRKCYLFAFSGKEEVKELDLSSTHASTTAGSYSSYTTALPQTSFDGSDVLNLGKNSRRKEAMGELLDFLSCSFEGGTDINEPIKRSLDLLCNDKDKDWNRADILIVTDSEIPPANKELKDKLDYQIKEHELEVHGLIVGPRRTANLKDICTDLHVFDEWDVIKSDY